MDLTILESELNQIDKQIEALNLALKTLPAGSLNINSINPYVTFCRIMGKVKDGNKIYLKKSDSDLIVKLAQKDYYFSLVTVLEKRKTLISEFLGKYPKTNPVLVYETLNIVRKKLVRPFVLSDIQYADNWKKKNTGVNDLYPQGKVYETDKGELVRSKSELFIANILYELNVPYRYEAEMKLSPKYSLYPDFTILNVRTRQELILEHFGLMDDEYYRTKAFEKIETYSTFGFVLGKNLLVSFESSKYSFNKKVVERMIRENCL